MDQEISDNTGNLALSTKEKAQQLVDNRTDAMARRKMANYWVRGCVVTICAGMGYMFNTIVKHEKTVEKIAIIASVGAVICAMKKMTDAQQAHDEAADNDKALVDLTGDESLAVFDSTRIEMFNQSQSTENMDGQIIHVPRVA